MPKTRCRSSRRPSSAILKELRARRKRDEPLVVSGAKELVRVLRQRARRVAASARPSASRGRSKRRPRSCTCSPATFGADDEQALKAAARRRLPIVAVAGPAEPAHVPYVLDENVVRVGSGTGFPVEEIARRLARRSARQGPRSPRGYRCCAAPSATS